MNGSKPYSQACENNKNPILEVLSDNLRDAKSVLEIGSGTGQHAVWFAAHMPWLSWQTADRAEYHNGILAWLADYDGNNLHPPLALDVNDFNWKSRQYDAVFSANTAHIMHWHEVVKMLEGVSFTLKDKGVFCLYGPMKYDSDFTSQSNADFDLSLKKNYPHMGIRNFEDITQIASYNKLKLIDDIKMPANNQLLIFEKY